MWGWKKQGNLFTRALGKALCGRALLNLDDEIEWTLRGHSSLPLILSPFTHLCCLITWLPYCFFNSNILHNMCFKSNILSILYVVHKFCFLLYLHHFRNKALSTAAVIWIQTVALQCLSCQINSGAVGSFFPPAVQLFRSGLPLGSSLPSLPGRHSEPASWQESSGSSQNSQQHGLCW